MAIENNERALICLAVAFGYLLSTALARGQSVSFIAQRDFDAGRWPFAVAIGDFNGDRAPDLAVANAGSDNVSVLINDTRGHAR